MSFHPLNCWKHLVKVMFAVSNRIFEELYPPHLLIMQFHLSQMLLIFFFLALFLWLMFTWHLLDFLLKFLGFFYTIHFSSTPIVSFVYLYLRLWQFLDINTYNCLYLTLHKKKIKVFFFSVSQLLKYQFHSEACCKIDRK